ncbi:MAG: acyl-CoA thioesterase [Acidimicrobiales bacterium]
MAETDLVKMLDLSPAGPDRFLGQNLESAGGVIFGGQLLAQSVAAAALTIPDMQVKSMHTIFLRGGRPDLAPELEIARLNEGRTFAGLDVSVRQGDRLCTQSLVLLHRPDPDFITYQDEAPAVAPPSGEPAEGAEAAHGWDVRIADGVDIADPDAIGPPELFVWSRFDDVPREPWVSQALLAYASDGFLIGTAMRPHPGVGQRMAHVTIATTVVTQTLTFHQGFDAGAWLLLAHRSPQAGQGRTFGRADVFTEEGRLVASYDQENMVRAMPDR